MPCSIGKTLTHLEHGKRGSSSRWMNESSLPVNIVCRTPTGRRLRQGDEIIPNSSGSAEHLWVAKIGSIVQQGAETPQAGVDMGREGQVRKKLWRFPVRNHWQRVWYVKRTNEWNNLVRLTICPRYYWGLFGFFHNFENYLPCRQQWWESRILVRRNRRAPGCRPTEDTWTIRKTIHLPCSISRRSKSRWRWMWS